MAYGFYNKGLAPDVLPHPPISLAVFLVVEEAVCEAWNRLRRCPIRDFDFQNATEDEVTTFLYEILYNEVFDKDVVDGFDRQLFTTVTRESKITSYDLAHLDKMPDLLIGLVGRSGVYKATQDWIYIECKPVDAKHSVGSHYCDKGIIRFVCGEYAWAMREALMIGYAKKGYDLAVHLPKALSPRPSMQTVGMPAPCKKSPRRTSCQPVYVTRHSRPFRYVETKQPAPEITIRHLWLNRD